MKKQKELLLHKIAAKFIAGKEIHTELKGMPAELDCLVELLEVSKLLKTKLSNKTSSLNDIIKIIEEKKQITQKFENLTGITWRL